MRESLAKGNGAHTRMLYRLYWTEMTLDELGVGSFSEPSCLPYINVILLSVVVKG